MSRQRRIRDRAKRARWLLTLVSWRERLLFGVSAQRIDWRRPLRNGLMLPFWRGCPLVAPRSRKAAASVPASGEVMGTQPARRLFRSGAA